MLNVCMGLISSTPHKHRVDRPQLVGGLKLSERDRVTVTAKVIWKTARNSNVDAGERSACAVR